MAKKKKAKKKKQPVKAEGQVRYKQMTTELLFTDGEIKTVTFYKSAECFRFIERAVCEHYADTVRVELF